MLYYKKRLSGERSDRYSVEWQLKSTTVPTVIASCEIRIYLSTEEELSSYLN